MVALIRSQEQLHFQRAHLADCVGFFAFAAGCCKCQVSVCSVSSASTTDPTTFSAPDGRRDWIKVSLSSVQLLVVIGLADLDRSRPSPAWLSSPFNGIRSSAAAPLPAHAQLHSRTRNSIMPQEMTSFRERPGGPQ